MGFNSFETFLIVKNTVYPFWSVGVMITLWIWTLLTWKSIPKQRFECQILLCEIWARKSCWAPRTSCLKLICIFHNLDWLDKKFSKWLFFKQNDVRDHSGVPKLVRDHFEAQKRCFWGFRLMSPILVFFRYQKLAVCLRSMVCSPKPTNCPELQEHLSSDCLSNTIFTCEDAVGKTLRSAPTTFVLSKAVSAPPPLPPDFLEFYSVSQ